MRDAMDITESQLRSILEEFGLSVDDLDELARFKAAGGNPKHLRTYLQKHQDGQIEFGVAPLSLDQLKDSLHKCLTTSNRDTTRRYLVEGRNFVGFLRQHGVTRSAAITPALCVEFSRNGEPKKRIPSWHELHGKIALEEPPINTQQLRVVVCRKIIRWLYHANHIRRDFSPAIAYPNASRNDRQASLRVNEVTQLRQLASKVGGTRLQMMVDTAYFAGARPGEIRLLRWQNVRMSDRQVDVPVLKKRGRIAWRTLPMAGLLEKSAREWAIASGGAAASAVASGSPFGVEAGYVFPSGKNKSAPLSVRWINAILDECLQRLYESLPAEDRKTLRTAWTPHCLRRSICLALEDQGLSLVDIQRFLNHAMLSTTQTYLNREGREHLDRVQKALSSLDEVLP